jgi:hypothetical protein
MNIVQRFLGLFSTQHGGTAEELEAQAESARIRDEQETIRLSQRSSSGANYESGPGPGV